MSEPGLIQITVVTAHSLFLLLLYYLYYSSGSCLGLFPCCVSVNVFFTAVITICSLTYRTQKGDEPFWAYKWGRGGGIYVTAVSKVSFCFFFSSRWTFLVPFQTVVCFFPSSCLLQE